LVDAKGQRVAMATDARNLDPRLEFTPPEDGVYVLQVQAFAHPPTESVFFAGSVKCPYLITVTDQPVATRVFPAVVPAQGSVEVALRGPGRNSEGEKISLDRSMVQGAGEVGWVVPKGAVTPLNVVCSRFPVRRGRFRGDGEPPLLEVPGVLGGELGVGVTRAEWGVAMKKGEKLQARMWSRSLGLGLEGEITVRSPGGETVASSASGADVFAEPAVTWTAAVDGEYRVAVRDLFGRTGEAREYVLEVGVTEPSFGGELVGAKPVVVGAGKSVALKVKVTLTGGWREPLVVRVGGLPEGVFAPEVAVPEKGGEVEVSLQAAENAAAGTALAHVSVWTRSAPLRMVGAQFALRGELQRGHSDSDVSRELWVSVGPQGTSKAAEEVKR
jgi:hypothetical protein